MPFAATWKDLDITTLSEISQIKTNIAVQLLSHVQLYDCSSMLGSSILRYLLEFSQINVH